MTEDIDTNILRTDGCPENRQRLRRTEQVVNLGLGANAVLAVAKLFAGVVGHSQALLADGVNSLSDVVYFIVVRVMVALSGKPADEDHPYGHHQFENVAALVIGAFVISTGLAIFWNSAHAAVELMSGRAELRSLRWFALAVALGTVTMKILLMINAMQVGKRIRSIAVMALARDHRNDIFASLGAAAGILFGLLGYPVFDPIAGALVAIIIAKTGIDILRESAHELMESVPSREVDAQIREHVRTVPGVLSIETIHIHRYGPYLIANLTIGVDGRQTIEKGDAIADCVETLLYQKIDLLRKVYIHYHPAGAA